MIINLKVEYIKAFEESISRYRNPAYKQFFESRGCPMCIITQLFRQEQNIANIKSCIPCPMAIEKTPSINGCTKFESYVQARKIYKEVKPITQDNLLSVKEIFDARANDLERILNIIKTWPIERLTVRGWKEL
jgi:hypothetical protein